MGTLRKLVGRINMLTFKNFHSNTVKRAVHTPDYPELCEYDSHLVFTFCGTATLTNPMYEIFNVDYGYFPVVKYAGKGVQGARIAGELYKVQTRNIPIIDTLESNGFYYKRSTARVECNNTGVVAFVYIGLPSCFPDNVVSTQNIHKANSSPEVYQWIQPPYKEVRF
jgi:gamma-glutamylcyclotransferase (GGCT)/AIG2-like uncharacterized protein YtfP